MVNKEEQKDVGSSFVLKGGIEKTQVRKKKKQSVNVSDIENDVKDLKNVKKEMHNYIDDLIADNKSEIAYLKSKQREQELEIKNKQENVKKLQNEKKKILNEENEIQKLYNFLKSDNVGLTKINVLSNKTSNFKEIENKVEPLIKSKQNQFVYQDEQNRLKNEYRASLFYPDDSEETKVYLEKQKQIAKQQKQEQKAQLEKQIEVRNNTKTLPISDVEKTLFPNGNLAEMDFPKAKELGEKIKEEENLRKELLSTYDLNESPLEADSRLLDRAMIQVDYVIDSYLNNLGLSSDEKKDVKLKVFKEIIFDIKNYRKILKSNFGFSSPKELLDLIDEKELSIMIVDYLKGSLLSEIIANISVGPDAAGVLKKSARDNSLLDGYTKEAIAYSSYNELPNEYKSIIIDILKEQLLDLNSKGYFFDLTSEPSKRIAESVSIRNLVKKYQSELLKFEIIDTRKFSFNESEKNLYYAIGNARIYNLKLDVFGNITGDLVDTSDHNEIDNRKLVKAARRLQEIGIIEPKFEIYHFFIPKERVYQIFLEE